MFRSSSTIFRHLITQFKIHVHLGFKMCTLMPEDGERRPRHVACIVGYNKFAVFGGNTYIITSI
jgi:hypothetical protein